MSDQWEELQVKQPEVAKQEILKLRKPVGAADAAHRSFASLSAVISEHSRERQLESSDSWIVCDRGEFESHWAGRGRTEPQIEKKWLAATAPKKFRKNLAFTKVKRGKSGKERKVDYVWVKKQPEYKDSDIVRKKVLERAPENMMDDAAAKAAVRGSKKLEIEKSGKASLGPGQG